MTPHHTPKIQKRMYRLWLLGLAVTFLVILWGYFSLTQSPGIETQATTKSAKDATRTQPQQPVSLPKAEATPFDPGSAAYVLSAFSAQGIHMETDSAPKLTLLPEGNSVTAQLILRNPQPELLSGESELVPTISYAIDPPYADGANAPAASGEFEPQKDTPSFSVKKPVRIVPYLADGRFAPYPTATVQARDAEHNELMTTRVVLPVSTEIGCRNCHTGPWKTEGSGGLSDSTIENIFAAHDRRNDTTFVANAAKGQTVVCASCHMEEGQLPNLSTAIHGFHATMNLRGPEACGSCHPSSVDGKTRFFRDFHDMWGMDCTRCHGEMVDHALSLLVFEAGKGKQSSMARMRQIQPVQVTSIEDITGRQPGVNLPVCSGCHDFSQKPDPGSANAFNKWTKTRGERFTYTLENTGMIRCPTCHGTPHALYPSQNPEGDDRDNLQPLQYQNLAAPLGKDGNCGVCHTVDMDYFVHHDLPQR